MLTQSNILSNLYSSSTIQSQPLIAIGNAFAYYTKTGDLSHIEHVFKKITADEENIKIDLNSFPNPDQKEANAFHLLVMNLVYSLYKHENSGLASLLLITALHKGIINLDSIYVLDNGLDENLGATLFFNRQFELLTALLKRYQLENNNNADKAFQLITSGKEMDLGRAVLVQIKEIQLSFGEAIDDNTITSENIKTRILALSKMHEIILILKGLDKNFIKKNEANVDKINSIIEKFAERIALHINKAAVTDENLPHHIETYEKLNIIWKESIVFLELSCEGDENRTEQVRRYKGNQFALDLQLAQLKNLQDLSKQHAEALSSQVIQNTIKVGAIGDVMKVLARVSHSLKADRDQNTKKVIIFPQDIINWFHEAFDRGGVKIIETLYEALEGESVMEHANLLLAALVTNLDKRMTALQWIKGQVLAGKSHGGISIELVDAAMGHHTKKGSVIKDKYGLTEDHYTILSGVDYMDDNQLTSELLANYDINEELTEGELYKHLRFGHVCLFAQRYSLILRAKEKLNLSTPIFNKLTSLPVSAVMLFLDRFELNESTLDYYCAVLANVPAKSININLTHARTQLSLFHYVVKCFNLVDRLKPQVQIKHDYLINLFVDKFEDGIVNLSAVPIAKFTLLRDLLMLEHDELALRLLTAYRNQKVDSNFIVDLNRKETSTLPAIYEMFADESPLEVTLLFNLCIILSMTKSDKVKTLTKIIELLLDLYPNDLVDLARIATNPHSQEYLLMGRFMREHKDLYKKIKNRIQKRTTRKTTIDMMSSLPANTIGSKEEAKKSTEASKAESKEEAKESTETPKAESKEKKEKSNKKEEQSPPNKKEEEKSSPEKTKILQTLKAILPDTIRISLDENKIRPILRFETDKNKTEELNKLLSAIKQYESGYSGKSIRDSSGNAINYIATISSLETFFVKNDGLKGKLNEMFPKFDAAVWQESLRIAFCRMENFNKYCILHAKVNQLKINLPIDTEYKLYGYKDSEPQVVRLTREAREMIFSRICKHLNRENNKFAKAEVVDGALVIMPKVKDIELLTVMHQQISDAILKPCSTEMSRVPSPANDTKKTETKPSSSKEEEDMVESEFSDHELIQKLKIAFRTLFDFSDSISDQTNVNDLPYLQIGHKQPTDEEVKKKAKKQSSKKEETVPKKEKIYLTFKASGVKHFRIGEHLVDGKIVMAAIVNGINNLLDARVIICNDVKNNDTIIFLLKIKPYDLKIISTKIDILKSSIRSQLTSTSVGNDDRASMILEQYKREPDEPKKVIHSAKPDVTDIHLQSLGKTLQRLSPTMIKNLLKHIEQMKILSSFMYSSKTFSTFCYYAFLMHALRLFETLKLDELCKILRELIRHGHQQISWELLDDTAFALIQSIIEPLANYVTIVKDAYYDLTLFKTHAKRKLFENLLLALDEFRDDIEKRRLGFKDKPIDPLLVAKYESLLHDMIDSDYENNLKHPAALKLYGMWKEASNSTDQIYGEIGHRRLETEFETFAAFEYNKMLQKLSHSSANAPKATKSRSSRS